MERLLKELKKYNDSTSRESILFIPETEPSLGQYFNIIPLSKLSGEYSNYPSNYLTVLNITKMIHTLTEIERTSEFKLNKIFGKDILNLQFCYKVSLDLSSSCILNLNIRYNCDELVILLSMVDLLSTDDTYMGTLTYESFNSSYELEEIITSLINENVGDR